VYGEGSEEDITHDDEVPLCVLELDAVHAVYVGQQRVRVGADVLQPDRNKAMTMMFANNNTYSRSRLTVAAHPSLSYCLCYISLLKVSPHCTYIVVLRQDGSEELALVLGLGLDHIALVVREEEELLAFGVGHEVQVGQIRGNGGQVLLVLIDD